MSPMSYDETQGPSSIRVNLARSGRFGEYAGPASSTEPSSRLPLCRLRYKRPLTDGGRRPGWDTRTTTMGRQCPSEVVAVEGLVVVAVHSHDAGSFPASPDTRLALTLMGATCLRV